jgi:hypothetical protein
VPGQTHAHSLAPSSCRLTFEKLRIEIDPFSQNDTLKVA